MSVVQSSSSLRPYIYSSPPSGSSRPITPGDNKVVYGIVMQKDGAIARVIGTAFAISDKLAISAWHNFTAHGYDAARDVVMLCKEVKSGKFLRSSCPEMVVSEVDVNDDWVTLHLSSGTFPKFAALCPEAELPSSDD